MSKFRKANNLIKPDTMRRDIVRRLALIITSGEDCAVDWYDRELTADRDELLDDLICESRVVTKKKPPTPQNQGLTLVGGVLYTMPELQWNWYWERRWGAK